MKIKLLCVLISILTPFIGLGQNAGASFKAKHLSEQNLSKSELKAEMLKYNFAEIWTVTNNAMVYGFIGDNYQRIRVKLISVTKDAAHPDQYNVYGKSMVKTNVCDFKGVLRITSIRKYSKTSYGVDDEYKNKGIVGQYTIAGNYLLSEDSKQAHSGIFKGTFQSEFYLTKDGKAHYDNIDLNADGYSNNQFTGTWTSYNKKLTQTCNWGDYRIPNSGSLDIGAGDLSPKDKYLQNGWKTIKNSNEENRAWWK